MSIANEYIENEYIESEVTEAIENNESITLNENENVNHEPFNYTSLVETMKARESRSQLEQIIAQIQQEPSLTKKCVLARMFLAPQSTTMETIIKNDLLIGPATDEVSGDGHKNGINYEIKYSGHARNSKINFVQIRPDHNVDYYIFVAYNMYDTESEIGKAYIFKVPSEVVYNLIVLHGGYAHGTVKKLGAITHENVKGRGAEYALRCNPNVKAGGPLWEAIMEYRVDYSPENF